MDQGRDELEAKVGQHWRVVSVNPRELEVGTIQIGVEMPVACLANNLHLRLRSMDAATVRQHSSIERPDILVNTTYSFQLPFL